MQFTELKVGNRAKVIGFKTCNKTYRQRLLSMGLTLGTEFKVSRVAPLGCPLELQVRGSSLSLRKQEASVLILESL